jgi:hypothetical protein
LDPGPGSVSDSAIDQIVETRPQGLRLVLLPGTQTVAAMLGRRYDAATPRQCDDDGKVILDVVSVLVVYYVVVLHLLFVPNTGFFYSIRYLSPLTLNGLNPRIAGKVPGRPVKKPTDRMVEAPQAQSGTACRRRMSMGSRSRMTKSEPNNSQRYR